MLNERFKSGNSGTLIRTATALGMKSVISVNGAILITQKSVQSSAGTIGQIPIIRVDEETFLEQTKKIETTALVVHDGVQPEEVDISNSILLV